MTLQQWNVNEVCFNLLMFFSCVRVYLEWMSRKRNFITKKWMWNIDSGIYTISFPASGKNFLQIYKIILWEVDVPSEGSSSGNSSSCTHFWPRVFCRNVELCSGGEKSHVVRGFDFWLATLTRDISTNASCGLFKKAITLSNYFYHISVMWQVVRKPSLKLWSL